MDKTMKKRITVIFAMLCCFVLLASCGLNDTSNDDVVDDHGNSNDVPDYPIEPMSPYAFVTSVDEIVGNWDQAEEDGIFLGGMGGVSITFKDDETGSMWIPYGDGWAQFEFSFELGDSGAVTITQTNLDDDPPRVLPDNWKIIIVQIARANSYSMLKFELADGGTIYVRSMSRR